MDVSKWSNILTVKNTSSTTLTYHIQPNDAILARLPQGNKASPKIQLRTAIEAPRSTCILPTRSEHRRLLKDLTPKITIIHPSWHIYIKPTDLPVYTPTTYATLSSTPLNTTKPTKRPSVPTTDDIPNPQHTVDIP